MVFWFRPPGKEHRELFGPVKSKSCGQGCLLCGVLSVALFLTQAAFGGQAGRARLWSHGYRVPGHPASDPLATPSCSRGLTPSVPLGSQGEEASWAAGSFCTLQVPRLTGFASCCSNLLVLANSSGIPALMLS